MSNCKFCGMGGLNWEQTLGNKWVLLDNAGQKHCCIKPKLKGTISAQTKEPKDFRNDPKINKALKIYQKQLEQEGRVKKDYILRPFRNYKK